PHSSPIRARSKPRRIASYAAPPISLQPGRAPSLRATSRKSSPGRARIARCCPRSEGHDRERQGKERDPEHRVPAIAGEQATRCKRAEGHRAEDKEVVERLHPGSLLRPMRFQHECGGADEAEIPAEAEQ